MNRPSMSTRTTVFGTAVLALSTLTACASAPQDASGSGTATASAAGAYTWWDPYPQHDAGSAWAERVGSCGQQAGVTIQRTAYDTTALTNQALLAGQEGNAPDVILLDNPAVSTLADAGMLSAMSDFGLDASRFDKNLIAAGELDGKTYGIPIGANTLALYYNKKILDEAGVDPASIKDWASLTAALKKVKAAGKKPITFAGIGTEEGSFQFLPWLWGAGAQLTQLDSPQAAEALELWNSWLKDGLAPNSVIGNSQNTSWEEFLTGEFAFGENGTWQINSAAKAGFPTGIVQIPAKDGGAAPTPTGGEFITVPVQKDTKRYDATKKILECMTTPEGLVETGTTFAYYIPSTAEGQEAILAKEPTLQPWVEAVRTAKGRTSDNLGTDYPKISEAMWTGVQKALSGAASPADALKEAQAQAKQATGD
ncbi:sugar ABC transporter substrate-binding protein [Planomonospora venezuelensis]|uniref:Multiple sugar transport system substrate-binding protein n=1 Tax=Planomonospora venezuelensis TaxID=1999 RepID=A0A841CX73_PLAVE|nr:extracellular solute-binding protein [Planomonospora venezuelensis]MBB5962521.1 multiple sugar transport system substrate-binding protein [Planomonospora venezuelensis]GIM99076.1 ABC transporter substrate-binding protein [Planomonospora venezuelensis]